MPLFYLHHLEYIQKKPGMSLRSRLLILRPKMDGDRLVLSHFAESIHTQPRNLLQPLATLAHVLRTTVTFEFFRMEFYRI